MFIKHMKSVFFAPNWIRVIKLLRLIYEQVCWCVIPDKDPYLTLQAWWHLPGSMDVLLRDLTQLRNPFANKLTFFIQRN